jgi:hypothetical protein
MPGPEHPAEARIREDRVVCAGLLAGKLDVGVSEIVLGVVVKNLRFDGPLRTKELRIGKPRADPELVLGEGQSAAERDAGPGEVRLGDVEAPIRRERVNLAARVGAKRR